MDCGVVAPAREVEEVAKPDSCRCGYTRHMSTPSSYSIRIVLAAAVLFALTGCGNKGPLVMPQKPVPVEVAPASTPEATPPASSDPATPSTQTDGQPSQPTTPADGKG